MVSTQVVETSVTNNSPSQDSNHPDDLFQSRYVTTGFKSFSNNIVIFITFLLVGQMMANILLSGFLMDLLASEIRYLD